MLRNTLSDNERYLMFYYYTACGGWHKTIAEEYALFYDVLPDELAEDEHYRFFEAAGIRGTGTSIHAFMCLKNVCK